MVCQEKFFLAQGKKCAYTASYDFWDSRRQKLLKYHTINEEIHRLKLLKKLRRRKNARQFQQ